MELLPLHLLGAREKPGSVVEFGLFLPWVSKSDGNQLWVKIIPENDQFLQDIKPLEFSLEPEPDLWNSSKYNSGYGEKQGNYYWSTKVDMKEKQDTKSENWGKTGRYVYRYFLKNPNRLGIPKEIDWIIDPFAREFGIGKLSAFTLGYEDYTWSANEEKWKTPDLNDIVIYELMINEFGGGVNGTIQRLYYLQNLGINCLELMPVSNALATIDWGYLPTGYFGVDERFGNRKNLQELIDEAHQRGISVILDCVYGHTNENFCYSYVYRNLKYKENPFLGKFGDTDDFGGSECSTNFNQKFTQDFFFTVNYHWLNHYHIDGFRYDCVPNYFDGSQGNGYANLVYNTYQKIKEKKGENTHWQRFFNTDNDVINLIQCAEHLPNPQHILESTYSNCTWQNQTLDAAKEVAYASPGTLYTLGMKFGLDGYPIEASHNNDKLKKTALQYIENHDHSRFICNFGFISNDRRSTLLKEGNRDRWYKLQPYLIGMFTAKGIPMLWQGQELGANYCIPDLGDPDDWGRVVIFRPVRWDYFYDENGKALISLIRKLIKLRRNPKQPQFRGFRDGNGGKYYSYYFYNDYERYQFKNVLLFSRQHENNFSLVALNFSDCDQTVPFWFPMSGDYYEELHGLENLINVSSNMPYHLTIPSNYGRIWTWKASAA
jgi:1,4-alpha-glucan branching enzyme